MLANITKDSLCAGRVSDMSDAYILWGWKADDYVLKTLSCVDLQKDFEGISVAINAIYLPWTEDAARYFQEIVEKHGYPGKRHQGIEFETPQPGECILFVDGLRFDTAKRLKK